MAKESEKKYEKMNNKLLDAHEGEMSRRGGEAYNLGWASGDTDHGQFIHSKTSVGRLYSEIDHGNGKVSHQWDGEEKYGKPPLLKRGTSTGYMTGGATEKKKVPKEYRGNTNSEGGIPFGKKPQ
jgi:hypothetical protein